MQIYSRNLENIKEPIPHDRRASEQREKAEDDDEVSKNVIRAQQSRRQGMGRHLLSRQRFAM